MISNVAMAGIATQGLIVILFFIGLFLDIRRREHFSFRPVWVGALVFFVFSQVLEKIMHLIVLQGKAEPHGFLANPPIFSLYGALAAGVFEEIGRFLGYRLLLKNNRSRKDGMAYGLGHGGFEAIYISVFSLIQALVFAAMINAGKLEESLSGKVPANALADIKNKILNVSAVEYLLGGLERIPAVFIQIALSLIVLFSVRSKKFAFLFTAILLHALTDFVPALYQAYKGKFSLWAAECVIWLFGIAAVWLIRRSRTWQIWSVQ